MRMDEFCLWNLSTDVTGQGTHVRKGEGGEETSIFNSLLKWGRGKEVAVYQKRINFAYGALNKEVRGQGTTRVRGERGRKGKEQYIQLTTKEREKGGCCALETDIFCIWSLSKEVTGQGTHVKGKGREGERRNTTCVR